MIINCSQSKSGSRRVRYYLYCRCESVSPPNNKQYHDFDSVMNPLRDVVKILHARNPIQIQIISSMNLLGDNVKEKGSFESE
jgi:hypothetical protein